MTSIGVVFFILILICVFYLNLTQKMMQEKEGDILIKSAAEVIAQSFQEYGIVARMGGDEFIAILETVAPEEIRKLTERFEENIRKKNREIKNLNMSIAYGHACCDAKESHIEKIYQTADDRMYEKKKQMKSRSAG